MPVHTHTYITIHTYNHTLYSHTFSSKTLTSLILISSVDCQTLPMVLSHNNEQILFYNFSIIFCRCKMMLSHPHPFSLLLLLWPGMTFQFPDLCKSSYSLSQNFSSNFLYKCQSFPSLTSFGISCECCFGNQSNGSLHIALFHVCMTCLTNQSYTYWTQELTLKLLALAHVLGQGQIHS